MTTPWLTDGKYTRQFAGSNHYERHNMTLVSYRTPSTANKTPLASMPQEDWDAWVATTRKVQGGES